jgi:hypothetical protein
MTETRTADIFTVWTVTHPYLDGPLVFDHVTKSEKVAAMLAFHYLRNTFGAHLWDLDDIEAMDVTAG